MDLESNDEVIELDWNKLQRNSKTAGLREGLSDGRDSTFQEYFDIGYREGFQAGFAMGKYVAALQLSREADKDKTESLLNKPTQAWCEMCNNSVEDDAPPTISHSIEKQRSTVDKNLQILFDEYANQVDIPVPKSLSREM